MTLFYTLLKEERGRDRCWEWKKNISAWDTVKSTEMAKEGVPYHY
jgi:hypothetical protein